MFCLSTDRAGVPHILYFYNQYNFTCHTSCGEDVRRGKVNIIAVDRIPSTVCKKCFWYYTSYNAFAKNPAKSIRNKKFTFIWSKLQRAKLVYCLRHTNLLFNKLVMLKWKYAHRKNKYDE